MIRSIDEAEDIHAYLKMFPRLLSRASRTCERCGRHDALVGHGTYRRWFITFGFRVRVRLQRLRCRSCGVTLTLMPPFMRSRSPYGRDVVTAARAARARGAAVYTLPASLERMGVAVRYATIRSWVAEAA